MSKSSIALHNLRGFAIMLLIAFHSAMAYLAYARAPHPRYDPAPVFSDSHYWIGFDLFCATQYVYVMQLMFLLSGLFVWPSLMRRGGAAFLYRRALRLGVPFVIGICLLMPAARYPVYRLTAVDPTWAGYWEQWTSLPFWPSGHLWFLWCLLAMDALAAALFAAAPELARKFGWFSRWAKRRPLRFFAAFLAISALVYVPVSMRFSESEWANFGPFSFQPSFMPLYVVCFFAGVLIGAPGLEAGLFSHDGKLPGRWATWAGVAVAGFMLWIAASAISMQAVSGRSRITEIAASIGFAGASAGACLALPAAFLRFATASSRILFRLGDNALRIYFFHLFFVFWLQYLLLNLPLFAFIKFLVVFTGSLALSWAAAIVASRAFSGFRTRLQRA